MGSHAQGILHPAAGEEEGRQEEEEGKEEEEQEEEVLGYTSQPALRLEVDQLALQWQVDQQAV